jgi:hypothetical protein
MIPKVFAMAKIQKKLDADQMNLFQATVELASKQDEVLDSRIDAGTLDVSSILRQLISESLKKSPLSRFQISAKMSELIGSEITKFQLDSWSAESKESDRFPLEYFPAFIIATGDKTILKVICEKCNGLFIQGEESLHLELGRLDFTKRQVVKKERAIKDLLETFGKNNLRRESA